MVSAYEANTVPVWALFCGKEILGQYKGNNMEEGAQLLTEWIDRLSLGESIATYQLRMYEDDFKGSVNNNTPYNYSFRFKLDDGEEVHGRSRTYGPYFTEMENRIKKLEAEKAALEEDDGEEIGGIQGFIGSILQKPEVQEMILNKFLGFMGGLMGRGPQAAAMSGVPVDVPGVTTDMATVYANLPADQQQQLNKALEILLTKDPQAGTRLYKIALILQDSPARYEMLAGML